jgi:hypothetical protein
MVAAIHRIEAITGRRIGVICLKLRFKCATETTDMVGAVFPQCPTEPRIAILPLTRS